jgi:hypothetical protein
MPTIPTPTENKAILNLLLQAGAQARSAAQQSFDVYEKGYEDYVTTVDQALDD